MICINLCKQICLRHKLTQYKTTFHNGRLVLCFAPVIICFKAAAANIQLACKARFFFVMQETDAITAAIKELGQEFPSLLAPLIFERDLFMVHRLRTVPRYVYTVLSCMSAGTHCPIPNCTM